MTSAKIRLYVIAFAVVIFRIYITNDFFKIVKQIVGQF